MKFKIKDKTSPGCAIGRHIPKDLAEELDLLDDSAVNTIEVFSRLPKNIKDLGANFLLEIQRLHDHSFNWTEEGLSNTGKNEYNKIVEKFKLN